MDDTIFCVYLDFMTADDFCINTEIVGCFLLQIRKKIKTPFLVLIAGNMLQNNETNHKHKGGDVPNKITRCIASMHGDPDTNP